MKKILTFIPLGIGISSAIIYLFNVFRFRIINSSVTLMQILSNLKIYLYVSIAGFLFYFFVKVLLLLSNKKISNEEDLDESSTTYDYPNDYEPFELKKQDNSLIKADNVYVPNYDYVPIYKKEEENTNINDNRIENYNSKLNSTPYDSDLLYCYKCGEKILSTDIYCRRCGTIQTKIKQSSNSKIKKFINVLEIVILILVLYFSVNMLFDYKEKKDPSFTSPFKFNMTK